ncbi:MAG: FAD-dependent oxidoreductase [Herbinix sp.]|jgi:ribulose 1,5-bisphosphate synthetase/thiazole synthase|nr:FAD-dependent oxidoreductase [Herbinix sp.]
MNTIQNTPMIYEADYVIIGSGLREVIAGITLRKKGYRVVMITRDTYLLGDICKGTMYVQAVPEEYRNHLLMQFFPKEAYITKEDYKDAWILHPDRFKCNAEKICDRYGVIYLYNVTPLKIIQEKKDKLLFFIGGKFGVSGVSCKAVIDFCKQHELPERNRFHVHIMNLSNKITRTIQLESKTGDIYSIIPGGYDETHGILQISCVEREFTTGTAYRIACKQRAIDAFIYLKNSNLHLYLDITLGRFAEDAYSSGYDYVTEYRRGIRVIENLKYIAISDFYDEYANHNIIREIESSYIKPVWQATNDTITWRKYPESCAMSIKRSHSSQYDVIVVGGGTAGAMAALHAARNGLSTLLLEMNMELGGTGTVGGVSTYWFGKRYRDVLEVDTEIQSIYERLSIERHPGIWSSYDDCNPGIKSFVLAKLCMEAGVILQESTIVFGVLKDSNTNRVIGVTAAVNDRIHSYYGKYIVDATGDGDIAAFAGANYTYGSERDTITYWGSLAQYSTPAKYRNNFSSTLMVSDPIDYTRFIRLGRCRGENTYDHGIYVSPRETRHIKGLYEVDLKDIISYRTYEDSIYTCFSNYDPKGKLSADMVYAGVLPPQVSIQIPLRALLPVDHQGEVIPGIIVAGKAISCTHNAFPSIRMQPDLMHQGTVIGFLLAYAIKTDIEPLKLNHSNLQRLIEEYTGDSLTLPRNVMKLQEVVNSVSLEDRCHWVDYPFDQEVKTEERVIRIMVENSDLIRPLLEDKYQEIVKRINNKDKKSFIVHEVYTQMIRTANQELIAGFLLWHGSDTGTKHILHSIITELNDIEGLPVRRASTMCAQLLPDHGVMPEVIYRMNLLAWSKSEQMMEPFLLVLDKLKNMNRNYIDIKQGIYHYIEVFPYVAERTGRKEFIPILKELLQFQELQEVMHTEFKAALLTERLLILVLSIFRALARCGDRSGYEGLVGLLKQDSLPIASSALKELMKLTKLSFGLEEDKWYDVIKNHIEAFPIQVIEEKVW